MIRKLTMGLVFIYGTFTSFETSAQIDSPGQLDGRTNTINTAVPFLRITPDARSGAMGDVGVATAPDANSIYWNLAKLPFADTKTRISATYTPWLKELVNDVFLATVSGYTQLDEFQAVSASLRYFSLGTINFTNVTGQSIGDFHPREFALDAGYSRRLSDHFAVGLTGRYIYSNLAGGQSVNNVTIKPGKAFAADISAFYTKDFEKDDGLANKLNLGVAITNIGTKISYTSSAQNKDFLPTNLGLGAAYTMALDENNQLTFALDVNKLLVPTPDSNGTYKNKSSLEGMFSSFGDAPGGFKEELQELMYSVGMEYWYSQLFAVRAGYFNENKNKGNRKYFTAGIGVKYDIYGLNVSYLVPSGSGIQRNPLSNTLRFTLTFDLGSRDESRTGW
ncbi:type IX secretion system outer membrane channel protein PorV [Chitinophaga nivalis]|uniref:Type IX secretion system outer membrane channel protein PorV n=1 Tax=Chitinophaga nivalis TaxID=2991709 RepID=A0ABT3IWH8_9BACT|nr:type IX secretion system outer membrane channel protein PorV [Chitinophaga nivalis]MCW3461968.1 type IX secretion system outer membrane channel protein PorV [Chitinophaga nivalis]MCW3488341.1 type IX secretion system outer membrane channel protein PorV [Chitinophaga nivalis]